MNATAVLRAPGNLPQGLSTGRCWYITFGLGKPAGKTFTRVQFARDIEVGEHGLYEVVRQIAVDLYGTAFAFVYRPDEADEAIHKYGLRLREHVDITELEVREMWL